MPKDIQGNLIYEYDKLSGKILEAIDKVLRSGRYILGTELEKFEKRFAEYIGMKYCVGVGNGYDALYLSYRVLGSKRVHIINELHVSTTNAMLSTGASKVKRIKNADTVVYAHNPNCPHMIETPVDIEDACQTVGKCEDMINKKSKLICFSFHPLKMLHCYGDGGAICTNHLELYNKLRQLRNHGRFSTSCIYYEGVNSRLDEIQAAILNVMLDNWEVVLELNRHNG